MKFRTPRSTCWTLVSLILGTAGMLCVQSAVTQSANPPVDPGVRGGEPGAGDPLPDLTSKELDKFYEFKEIFEGVEGVAEGLGPRFNLDSCVGCHIHPAVGGSSPATNPQIAVATKEGATNTIPPFLSQDGPIREVRRIRHANGRPDGGVQALFTITGRSDAQGCEIAQPDFSDLNNFSFRIPTPTFGIGLIEAISDETLYDNLANDRDRKRDFGIRGKLNTNDNDGTVTRFGWKAQNKSVLVFTGEAYNVEMGITSDLFPNEREDACQLNATPEDHFYDMNNDKMGDVLPFALFMRLLNQPMPAEETRSVAEGRRLFDQVGCALCHTPTLPTGHSSIAALSNKKANLYSDLALHDMGEGLADGISQGQAKSPEFRTAPLWGLGQRIFFLHDGRTTDLLEAIRQHASSGSEANKSVQTFNDLTEDQKQDILNFLRSL